VGGAAPVAIKIEQLETECVCCTDVGGGAMVVTSGSGYVMDDPQTVTFEHDPDGANDGEPASWHEEPEGPIDDGVSCGSQAA